MKTTVSGREWVLVGEEPYTRRDGTTTAVLVWRADCAKCGAPFEIRTPRSWQTSKAFGVKHCPAHRMTKEEVRKNFGEVVRRRAKERREQGRE